MVQDPAPCHALAWPTFPEEGSACQCATFPSEGSATHSSRSTHFWVPKVQPPTANKVFSLGFLKREEMCKVVPHQLRGLTRA